MEIILATFQSIIMNAHRLHLNGTTDFRTPLYIKFGRSIAGRLAFVDRRGEVLSDLLDVGSYSRAEAGVLPVTA